MQITLKSSHIALWCFPLAVLAVQLLPPESILVGGIVFSAFGFTKRFRVLLLFGFMCLGHLFWLFTAQYFTATLSNVPLSIVLNRFGLLGYVLLFAVWARVSPCVGYLKLGSMNETLKAPFIWRGRDESVRRFMLIACSAWIAPAIVFTFLHGDLIRFMPYALLFALVNPILEGVVWRGLILGRAVSYVGEEQGLFLSSLAFGIYHLSLGFSIWACLLIAVGGFYMGGIAVKSRGFFAATLLHICVNLALISFGIIF